MTATRQHEHSITLPVAAADVFAILHTPSAIRQWWQAARVIVLAREGGVWAATWGDDEDAPDYITTATIEVFDPPRRMRLSEYQYFARTGAPPFTADFTAEFTVTPVATGSVLRVVQAGFPADAMADDFYAACEKGWHDTFESIRCYLNQAKS